MHKLSIAYFGTPSFSAQFLEKLITDTSINRLIEVRLIVTQKDKPVGRKQTITKSPVKIVGEKYNISVIDNLSELLKSNELKNMDFAFLFAYGSVIPETLLNQPRLGFLNTHPSLLPLYRGPSPIALPLILGDKKTGVTLIKLDNKIDHGPIISQETIAIPDNYKRPEMETKLTNLAFRMFQKLVNSLVLSEFEVLTCKQNHKLIFVNQDHKKASFARKLFKEDGYIPLTILKKVLKNEPLTYEELPKIIQEYYKKSQSSKLKYQNQISKLKSFNSPLLIFNYFRGVYPWPGFWTFVPVQPGRLYTAQQKRLKIIDMQYLNGKITILRVQLEGKKEVDFNTFNNAYQIF